MNDKELRQRILKKIDHKAKLDGNFVNNVLDIAIEETRKEKNVEIVWNTELKKELEIRIRKAMAEEICKQLEKRVAMYKEGGNFSMGQRYGLDEAKDIVKKTLEEKA